MKFEDVLPALRKGKKVRRAVWDKRIYAIVNGACLVNDLGDPMLHMNMYLLEDDWEIVAEPKRVATYLIKSKMLGDRGGWFEMILEVDKQPKDAVLIPGSERTVDE